MLPDGKKAIVVGETKLCTQCVEYLLEQSWKIHCIVSDDPVVINWAKSHNLAIVATSKLNTIEEQKFYLFSIINPIIIPQAFLLDRQVLLALNYHDSPLPKYAGVNSTTWSILNNEKVHGVTLHQITPGIDEGDIAAQEAIEIEENETALSLNLKCSEKLLSIFAEVITKLEQGTLTFTKQNAVNKTYFGLKHIPFNYGIINGTKNLEEIYRLSRALNFGDDYDNPVATTKVFLNGKFYIGEDFSQALLKDSDQTDHNAILFNKVRDIYGNLLERKITYKDLLGNYQLGSDELQYLALLKAKERKHKQRLLDLFNNSDNSIKILEDNLTSLHKEHIETIALPNNLETKTALALICLVLARLFYRDNFLVSLYQTDTTIPQRLRGLVDKRNFICLSQELLKHNFKNLKNYCSQLLTDSFNLIKDFGYRYQLNFATDVAIVIGAERDIDNHKLLIIIDNNAIIIKGDDFYPQQIKSIKEAVKTILNKDISKENLKKINLLSKAQYQQIVYEWNQTDKPYPKNKTIHKLFEEQVKRTPNNIAVVYENTKLTYKELNEKANQLAYYLSESYQIKPDNLVALCLDRSEYMIIGMLAVLKAGGAYVPIDPVYPDVRVKDILLDTNTKVILTDEILQDKIEALTQNTQQKVIAINNKDFISNLSEQIKDNPKTEVDSTNLAYVIYTSGTTGTPKGVMVEHKGVVNYATYLITHNELNSNSKGSQYASISFDAMVIEIYPVLLSGGVLYIITEQDKADPVEVNSFFKTNHITYAFLPTKFAELFFDAKNEALKNLIVGGEKLEKFFPQAYKIINAYGPTEGTVQTTSFLVDRQYNNIPIGKPINNIKCYIVDGDLNLLPVGAIGELVIGGTGVARGYLNLPDLTSQKFISNPFQSKEEKSLGINSRLYKTGDLVRYLPDGNIEYIGRDDNQVKIRGYRIELGEIENRLLNYPQIKQAVVVAREKDQHKYLVAYYVADGKLDEGNLRNYLSLRLPDYMMPSALMQIQNMPLNASGKVDKRKLPESKFTNNNYVAPKNALQSQIETLWSEVLSLPKESIGITNSFFKLGGDSILAIHLVSLLVKIEECKHIKVVDIFKYATIEKLTQFITEHEPAKRIISQNQNQLETDVAIIAFSGAFSGCENSDEYWDLIRDGREGIKKYSLEECKKLGVSEQILSNANFVPASGHVTNIDKFDAACWDLVPNEAKALDPQIRKFLEHSWCILEASGYFNLRDKINIGVFAGSGNSSYFLNSSEYDHEFLNIRDFHYLNVTDILATKTSFLLGLTGPSLNINTACSTSLVTVIEACKNLAAGYCDMAIAGGVSLLMPEEAGHLYQEGMIYSKEEHCRVFDDKASGIIHGSGVGVVLLKRLSDAKRDKDNIIAVIKGYAINNDGNNKMSFTSPSVIGQKECIVNAQHMAKISSDAIGYVECHGTGTRLGDPIEVNALDEAFKYDIDQNKNKKTHTCIIGSVKANIGHADSAAGIAGLIKVCMMLEHKIIPKQINYDTPNKELYLSDTNFEIVTETKAWEKTDNQPRIAAVSSFGIGGTNAHAIISEYVAAKEDNDEEAISAENLVNYILPITAKTQSSLEAYKNDFIAYLQKTPESIQDIAYTLQTKREHFNYRIAIAARSSKDAINKLKVETRINNVKRRIDDESNIIFMFPGQGSQYANMSLSLYQNDQDYKNTVDQCIQLVNKNTDIKFESVLFPKLYQNKTTHDINQTEWAQPALFVTQYSLAKLLEKINIHPTCYIGHSIGEYVAATLAGVFTLEDAIKLVVTRAKLMQTMPKGAMLAINSDTKAVEAIIKKHECEIAVINSEQNCVASGECINIEKLKTSLAKENIGAVSLKVSHAFHSHFMDEAAKKLFITLNQIKFNLPCKPFVSNVTGNFITASEAINPEYWAKHLQSAVLFSKGINTLCEYYHDPIFIEVGAGKTLTSFINQHNNTKGNTIQLLNSFKENQDGLPDLDSLEAIHGRLWVHGFKYDFNSDDVSIHKTIKLPPYHFDTVSYWLPRKARIISESSGSQITEKAEGIEISNFADIKNKVIEKDLPDKYYAIAKVYLDVLGIEKISVNDDLAALGINSLMAVSLVAKLQKDYKISMDEFLKLQTIAKIAEFAPFVKNNLKLQLEKIQLLYAKKAKCLTLDVEDMMAKQAKYLLEVEKLEFKPHKKAPQKILLTGATGHVGCNILYQLLHNTEHKIYLSVRAKSEAEAFVRVNNKFEYYFDLDLINYKNRVVILTVDLEKPNLGLSLKQYQELATNLTSIIHSAALVKHYGTYEEAYKTNVQTTINLLELSKLTSNKDFHYISTLGVLVQDGYVPSRSYYVFYEDDDASIVMNRNNTYARTKYEAEEVVKKYRQFGITANIYRLGNVAMHSTNYRHQENISDNAFFVVFKTILKLRMMYQEISQVEISPVDCTAEAIVKLFDQANLGNQTYHISNPHIFDLNKFFITENIFINTYSINEFISKIVTYLENKQDTVLRAQIELFMLHQKWLQEVDTNNVTQIKVLQDKTNIILQKLGFCWPKVTQAMLSGMTRLTSNMEKKMNEKPKIFNELEKLASLVPTAFYWTDKNSVIVGVNQSGLKIVGDLSYDDIIGKNPFDLYPIETAKIIDTNTKKVVQTGKTLSFEESVADITTGKIRYYTVTRSPLFEDGKVVGTVGVTVEITAEKEAERLRLENENQKLQLEQAAKLRQVADAVVHDIGSPLMALKYIMPLLKDSGESARGVISSSINGIREIVGSLRIKYDTQGDVDQASADLIAPELLAGLLETVYCEKRVTYDKYSVNLDLNIADDAQGLFANINAARFKRIVSNIINNAVEAIAKAKLSPGCVNIMLFKKNDAIFLQIKDNGCGFPKAIIEKLGTERISTKKEDGHGIGLSTAIQYLKEWHGEYHIDSQEGVGVTFTVKLPIAKAPDWFQEDLNLAPGSLVVVLDDDESIHEVWESRFSSLRDQIKLYHYNHAALFLEKYPELKPHKQALYLIDYELLGSNVNGVEVIQKLADHSGIFLVTSHYEDENIRAECEKLKVKIIPKYFAAYIPIGITADMSVFL